ncbi:MAG: type 4a pilus biogenesis protein PilO [Gemmatimonadaceae bacterium]
MDIKLPTSQRDQLLLFACFAAFGAIFAFHRYVLTPRNAQLDTLALRVEKLTTQNDAARREVASGTAAAIREEADRYGRLLAVMRQLVPTANEVPALLDQISTAARRTGIELVNYQPLGTVQGPIFDTHKFRFTVSGSYHRIGQFLTSIGSLTRIMAPMNVSVSPSDRPVPPNRPRESSLDARFELQTYVAKTAPAGGT